MNFTEAQQQALSPTFTWTQSLYHSQVDAMGILYHSHYLTLCEHARTDIMRDLENQFDQDDENKPIFAIKEVSIRYRKSLHFDDKFEIKSIIFKRRPVGVTWHQSIFTVGENPALIAELELDVVCVGHDMRPQKIPPHYWEALSNAGH